MPASFNSSGLASGLTLSNGNLTVEHTGADVDANVILGSGQTTGKYYVEFTVDVFSASDFNTLQFGLATAGVANNILLWADSNAIGTATAGAGWWINFSANGATASYVQGDTVDIAWDAGAGKIAMRVNNGSWYGSNSSADPAAGTNMQSFAPGGTLAMRVSMSKQNQKVTAVTSSGSWARSAPSGFGELPGDEEPPESIDEDAEDGSLSHWFGARRARTFHIYYGDENLDRRTVGFMANNLTFAALPRDTATDEIGWVNWLGTRSRLALAVYQPDPNAGPLPDDDLGVTGTLDATEAADAAAIAGVLEYSGTLAAAEGSDTAAISGSVAGAAVSGTLAATEGADTAAISGVLEYSGALAATEGSDTALLSGSVAGAPVTGTLAATEASDVAAIVGSTPVLDSAGSGAARVRRSAYELAQALAERRRKKDEEPAPEPVKEPVAPEAAERILPPALPPPPAAVFLASPAAGGADLWARARETYLQHVIEERRRLAEAQADDDEAVAILLLAS